MGPEVQPKCFRHEKHMRNNWKLRKRGYLIKFGHTEALLLKKKDIRRPFFPPCRNWPIWDLPRYLPGILEYADDRCMNCFQFVENYCWATTSKYIFVSFQSLSRLFWQTYCSFSLGVQPRLLSLLTLLLLLKHCVHSGICMYILLPVYSAKSGFWALEQKGDGWMDQWHP